MKSINNEIVLSQFIGSTSRWERYRLAQKTLRYPVYRAIEGYVLISFLLSLTLLWISNDTFISLLAFNSYIVGTLGVVHHAKLAAYKPWILMGAAFEAFILWTLYEWIVRSYFILSYFWIFCVFIFVARYWQRGERDVNWSAFQTTRTHKII
ncbi:hypothetical protein [Endozoicomonas sp. ALE010]|uniref:hypothetical protein n=1 Tax=Endozoicomonas sp. ALE010 TaxID=3403081 RepID=UPI003BB571B5